MDDLTKFAFKLGWVLVKTEYSKRGSEKELRKLGGGEEERILLQKIGKFWNQQTMWDRPDGLVVVTTHRLVFLAKLKTITTATEFLSIPYELMNDIEATRVMWVSPAISFHACGNHYMFTFFSDAEEVVDTVVSAKESLGLGGTPVAAPRQILGTDTKAGGCGAAIAAVVIGAAAAAAFAV